MTVIPAFILGIVQGLTELLPISSSAHLALIPWMFNWDVPEYFDVALHAGTLLAIGLFFFKDWLELIKGGFDFIVKKDKNPEGRMFWFIVLATIPGGIIGLILDKLSEETIVGSILNAPLTIAIMLIVMGIVLYFADKKSKSITEYKKMSEAKNPYGDGTASSQIADIILRSFQ